MYSSIQELKDILRLKNQFSESHLVFYCSVVPQDVVVTEVVLLVTMSVQERRETG